MRCVTNIAIVLGALIATGALAGWLSTRSDDARPSGAVCDAVLSKRDVARDQRRPIHRRRAVQRFVNGLRPGETGCLRRGAYVENVAIRRSGIALRSHPGERARLVGRLWIQRRARDVTISHLVLDGRNARDLPSPTVNGDRVTFARVRVTNRHTTICFVIGSERYGRATGTVIEASRIHDCGRLPPRNTEHGIYVAAADDTRIVGNEIHDNADRGIQLYPDAQRTVIEGNVIDGNGVGIIFSGDGGRTSDDTIVRHNLITNSRVRADVESYYPAGTAPGERNLVVGNCIHGGKRGEMDARAGGFQARDNLIADPGYADRANGDFSVDRDSPCGKLLARGR